MTPLEKQLAEALMSAAMTAHYNNKDFCHGLFDECRNCKKWRDVLAEYNRQLSHPGAQY